MKCYSLFSAFFFAHAIKLAALLFLIAAADIFARHSANQEKRKAVFNN